MKNHIIVATNMGLQVWDFNSVLYPKLVSKLSYDNPLAISVVSIVEVSKSLVVGYSNSTAVQYDLLPNIRYAGSITHDLFQETIVWDNHIR